MSKVLSLSTRGWRTRMRDPARHVLPAPEHGAKDIDAGPSLVPPATGRLLLRLSHDLQRQVEVRRAPPSCRGEGHRALQRRGSASTAEGSHRSTARRRCLAGRRPARAAPPTGAWVRRRPGGMAALPRAGQPRPRLVHFGEHVTGSPPSSSATRSSRGPPCGTGSSARCCSAGREVRRAHDRRDSPTSAHASVRRTLDADRVLDGYSNGQRQATVVFQLRVDDDPSTARQAATYMVRDNNHCADFPGGFKRPQPPTRQRAERADDLGEPARPVRRQLPTHQRDPHLQRVGQRGRTAAGSPTWAPTWSTSTRSCEPDRPSCW